MAAGKRYVWAVDAMSDGAGGMLFAQLLAVVEGCVVPEPSRRLTLPKVLDTLMALQCDLAAGTGGGMGGGGVDGGRRSVWDGTSPVVVPPPRAPGGPAYDVLAIVSALETLNIDAGAVIDAIGGKSASSLDALQAAGVPYLKCLAVKRALSNDDRPTGPVKVCTMCVQLLLEQRGSTAWCSWILHELLEHV